ncbi:hypothetical protein GOP47_0027042 [Adiantum capillus-veneris]|nr:hypothetical protein GOP47_0027042 [Adiantum capillus-veneris]
MNSTLSLCLRTTTGYSEASNPAIFLAVVEADSQSLTSSPTTNLGLPGARELLASKFVLHDTNSMLWSESAGKFVALRCPHYHSAKPSCPWPFKTNISPPSHAHSTSKSLL